LLCWTVGGFRTHDIMTSKFSTLKLKKKNVLSIIEITTNVEKRIILMILYKYNSRPQEADYCPSG
jgi:hypothetical protein